jgi:hypothetical protein
MLVLEKGELNTKPKDSLNIFNNYQTDPSTTNIVPNKCLETFAKENKTAAAKAGTAASY